MGSKFAKFLAAAALVLASSIALAEEDHLFVHVLDRHQEGDLVRIELELEVPAGHHVYRSSVKIVSPNAGQIQLDLPPGTEEIDKFTREKKEFYTGLFRGNLIFNAQHLVGDELTLRYQACTDEVCFLPQETQVVFAKSEHRGWKLLHSFVGGLAVALTPCIYPLLPITLGIFARKAIVSQGLSVALYALGLASTYGVLGVASSLSGALFGQWMQMPIVIGILALFFFFLSLSYLTEGGMTLKLIPRRWENTLESQAHWGPLTLFLVGSVTGLLASPCVTPVLLGLLVFVAREKSVGFGFVSLFSFGLGISVPLMILAFGAHWGVKRLPTSGPWMDWIKRILSLGLMAAVFYLAFPLPRAMYAALVFIAGLAWLVMFIRSFHGSREKFIITSQAAMGILIAGIPIAIVVGYLFQKPKLDRGALCSVLAECESKVKPGEWYVLKNDFPEHTPFAVRPGIWLIDFRADWCFSCKELEKEVLTKPAVLQFMKEKNINLLEWDLTTVTDRDRDQLQEWSIKGLPFLILVRTTASGEIQELQRWTGLMSQQDFMDTMRLLVK